MAQLEFQQRKNKSTIWIFSGLMIAILLGISSILIYLYPFASNEKKTYFQGTNPILFEGTQQGNARLEGDTLFIPLTFLQKNIDNTILYDEKSESVIITTAQKVIQMPTDSLTFFVNEKPVDLQISPIITKEGETYVALDPLLSYFPIEYNILDHQVIWIQKDGDKYQTAKITDKKVHEEKLRLRTESTWQSPYTDSVKLKEQVMIEGEKEDFYLVRKENGVSGYLKKEYVQKDKEVVITIQQKSEPLTIPKIDGKSN